jgi:hypothetical protein
MDKHPNPAVLQAIQELKQAHRETAKFFTQDPDWTFDCLGLHEEATPERTVQGVETYRRMVEKSHATWLGKVDALLAILKPEPGSGV